MGKGNDISLDGLRMRYDISRFLAKQNQSIMMQWIVEFTDDRKWISIASFLKNFLENGESTISLPKRLATAPRFNSKRGRHINGGYKTLIPRLFCDYRFLNLLS